MNFLQNNLSQSGSPYLRKHEDQLIWWQEWSLEVLEYAKDMKKMIFVSIGYSSCHWCNVMSREAFSDLQISNFMNLNFVSIKVDREQRPDIDQYAMHFLISQTGQGGWPLNIIFTPDLKPFYALNYAPLEPGWGQLDFFTQLLKTSQWYNSNKTHIKIFKMNKDLPRNVVEETLESTILKAYDSKNHGFTGETKFPSHSTLLFLLYYYDELKNDVLKKVLSETLDQQLKCGLYDHLAGGFFRYCVDSNWRIPHFEKMLYDQAMLIWIYSVAAYKLDNDLYRNAVDQTITMLESWNLDELYASSIDAETEGKEGVSYLWSIAELNKYLTEEELDYIYQNYDISRRGFIENIHLYKNKLSDNTEVEEKLLKIRNSRKQPKMDLKINTSWNLLLAISFVHAGRYLGKNSLIEKAKNICDLILERHSLDDTLYHSYFDGSLQKESFLSDYATLCLLLTYLIEEDDSYEYFLEFWFKKLISFRIEGKWRGEDQVDFHKVEVDFFDQPIPSTRSIAELAYQRCLFLLNKEDNDIDFESALSCDFWNISVLINKGYFYRYKSNDKLDWKDIPLNSMQKETLTERSKCYKGVCRFF